MVAMSNLIDIDNQQVLQYIGYDSTSEPPLRILSLIDEYAENVHNLIAPSYYYTIRDVGIVLGSSVVIDGPLVFQSEVIARLLEKCEKVAVFAATIGGYLEEMIAKLSADKLMIQASVLDGIGSTATEKMAEFMHGIITRQANNMGLYTSRRFSPGYCDWEVEQQKMLFRAIDSDSAGINLTEGGIMLPRKSISGIIGIGSRAVGNYNPCETCAKDNCVGRRTI